MINLNERKIFYNIENVEKLHKKFLLKSSSVKKAYHSILINQY